MKKIINGKKYDTDTAQSVGQWDNGRYTDFSFVSEELYRKKTGEFFIHGEGGPMSKYAEHAGNTTCSGEQIHPISWEAAREWVEEHLDVDTYEKFFGEVSDEESVNTNVTFAADVYNEVKKLAVERRIGLSDLVNAVLREYLSGTD